MNKDVRINVRCSEEQRSAWKVRAEAEGYRTLSAWLTDLANKSAGSAETVPVPSALQHPAEQLPEITRDGGLTGVMAVPVSASVIVSAGVLKSKLDAPCNGSKHRNGVYCKFCRKVIQ